MQDAIQTLLGVNSRVRQMVYEITELLALEQSLPSENVMASPATKIDSHIASINEEAGRMEGCLSILVCVKEELEKI